jgi:hypothetical protein
MYLGKSAPGIADSFDSSARQKQQDELERQKTLAALAQIASQNKERDQSTADAAWKQKQLESDTAEQDAGKAQAQTAFHTYTSAGKLADTLKGITGIDEAQPQMPPAAKLTGSPGANPESDAIDQEETDAKGPLVEQLPDDQYANTPDIRKLADMTPVQRMNEAGIPYMSQYNKGLGNMYSAATVDEDKQNALDSATATADANRQAKADEAKAHDETLTTIAQMNNATREKTAKTQGAGNGGALRGPGATALRIMQQNSDWKIQNAKVSASVHAMNLLDQAKGSNGKYDVNQLQSPELAMTLANLVSGSNSHTIEEFRAMNPETLQKTVASAIGYFTGKPQTVLSQEWAQTMHHAIARQAIASEDLRDKDGGYAENAVDAVTAGIPIDDDQKEQIITALKNYGPKFSKIYPEYAKEVTNPGQGGGAAPQKAAVDPALIAKAQKALSDPTAPQAAKDAARKILGQ